LYCWFVGSVGRFEDKNKDQIKGYFQYFKCRAVSSNVVIHQSVWERYRANAVEKIQFVES